VPVDCDSCRTVLPGAAVDSLGLGDPPAGALKTMALILALPAFILLVACGTTVHGCIPRD